MKRYIIKSKQVFTGLTDTPQPMLIVVNDKKIEAVLLADADLEGAVEWAMIGIFLNQGEICSAGSRILVEESLKDKFVKQLLKIEEMLQE